MSKIKQYKSVNEVIWKGHFIVNIPVNIIMALPLLSLAFFSKYIQPKEYIILLMIIAVVLGFILGWAWWSFSIAKWRVWAIENTNQKDWKELNKKAVEGKLIWQAGHRFEKTEFRSQKEQRKIEKFYQKIKEENLNEDLTLDSIEDDLSIPSEIQYYFNRSDLIFKTIFNTLLLFSGIYILTSHEFGTGLFLTGIMLYTFDYKAITKINNRNPQLQINDEGIEIDFLKYGLVKWSDTQDLVVDTDEGILTLTIWRGEEPFDITYSINELELKDYDEFLRTVNVFMKRAFIKDKDDSL